MDWYVEPRNTTAVPLLRKQIMAYLRRHAAPGRDPGDAELVISELLANALEHTDGPAWVSVRWDEAHPILTVADLGPGFAPGTIRRPLPVDGLPADRGRGLFLVTHFAQDFEVVARSGGGNTVRATLDVVRVPARPPSPPRQADDPLPLPSEPSRGAGGREGFLRALVVHLMQAVELQYGPEAAGAAINQVGTDVGQRLEAQYRAARVLAGRLTPQQLGECLARLKREIGGEFDVVEADEHRVVLASTRCPFGPGVRRTPGLCRMTAGVFGGIATRNVDGGEVRVQLEERIAVGDPACRIVVWLQPVASEVPAGTQRFLAPR
ncbi:MAG TPA: ATP-binding protein [Kineosporiaceae bacterium]|nr:ATP-binding protein [Kineosporiaceae bacterium]